jgi:hypothetical protein
MTLTYSSFPRLTPVLTIIHFIILACIIIIIIIIIILNGKQPLIITSE